MKQEPEEEKYDQYKDRTKEKKQLLNIEQSWDLPQQVEINEIMDPLDIQIMKSSLKKRFTLYQ